ncbi:MAG TPA: hypothetical protein VF007_03825 [Stellaceae bacterium]
MTDLVFVIATLVRNFRIEWASPPLVKAAGLVTVQPAEPPLFLLRRLGVAG